MISAKLIKDLEREGFSLDFPGYESNEERIIEILKEGNQRLNLALPLILRHGFDYKMIMNKLTLMKPCGKLIKDFKKMIIISSRIFELEGIDNGHLESIIRESKIEEKIRKEELQYYYDSFKEYRDSHKKKTAKMDKVLLSALVESFHKRIAYLKGLNIVRLSEYAKMTGEKPSILLNKAKRQTIPAFREKGVWKIGIPYK